jgi:NADH:ubiquinone oxidoreductase subunit 5 (subunit L)/multisubunit Na+/H+ antiporter MnhA subunit
MDVLLVAVAVLALTGALALLFSKWPHVATWLGAGGAFAGCLVSLVPTLRVLLGGSPESLRFAWDAAHGSFSVELDALSAFFLLPVLGLSALAAVYGGDYLFGHRHAKSLGGPWFFFNLFVAGMLMVLVARTAFLQQRDIKRVLAYSSIENMGLIGLALGVGLWGWASHLPVVAALGMTAGFLHIWNHALMKGLLFFAGGSILHGAGTKDMEKLGGLAKRMPWTASALIVGAVAIAALPPLNGFVSEWLMYLGLLKSGFTAAGSRSLPPFLAVGLLALIGSLAAVAFVRLTGIVLLGSPRSEAAQHAHESSPWMLVPMQILVVLCFAVAIFPQAVTVWTAGALDQLLGRQAGGVLVELQSSGAPLAVLGSLNSGTLIAITAGMLGFSAWSRRTLTGAPTWGCGYVGPTVRMQYTGRSFAEMIAEHLLPRFLRPHTAMQAPRGLFPTRSDFGSATPDPVSERIYEPFFRRWTDRFSRLRVLQQGKLHVYLVYIFVMVVAALAWASLRTWWSAS